MKKLRITPKIKAIIFLTLWTIFFPPSLMANELEERLRQFGLPANASIEEVEKQYKEYITKNEEGSLLYIYYTNLYLRIKKAIDAQEQQIDNKVQVSSSQTPEKQNRKGKRFKKRLFIGEGDFSFTVAFLIKHPELANSIVATEFDSEETLREKHELFAKHMEFLRKLKVDIRFGIDAKELEKMINRERFKRIHFNCPYSGSSDTTRILVELFFQNAARLQKPGDRIHIVLPKPEPPWERQRREGLDYDIYSASTKAGYQYIKKRKFSKKTGDDQVEKRYKDYQHVMTKGAGSADVTENSREYIFEKTDLLLPNQKLIIAIKEALEKNKGFYKKIWTLRHKLKKLKETKETEEKENKKFVYKKNATIKKWGKELDETQKKLQKEWVTTNQKAKERIKQLEDEVKILESQLKEMEKAQKVFVKENQLEEWLKLARELASYGPNSKPGFNSKIFFGENVPSNKTSFEWRTIGSWPGEKTIFNDAFDFLIPGMDKQVVYYYKSSDASYTPNTAIYPLPDVRTDSDSSDYEDSDEDEVKENEELALLKDQIKTTQEFETESIPKNNIGPRQAPGYSIEDVSRESGNCFYEAAIHQFQLTGIGRDFLSTVPTGTLPHNSLRLRLQGNAFNDGQWADWSEILTLARTFNIAIGILDTRHINDGLFYLYVNNDGEPRRVTNRSDLPENMRIIRLAYTGNHYLSITKSPEDEIHQLIEDILHKLALRSKEQ